MRGTVARRKLEERSCRFQTAASYPVGDGLHTLVKVGFGSVRVLGEGEDELGVVGIGEDVEVVLAGHLCEGCHVNIEQHRAEGRTLGYAADDVGGFGLEGKEADSLGAAGEEGCGPVEGFFLDPSFVEADFQSVVEDRVEGG
ncbi:hypothetical protein NDU88_005880 [Pleurodeles waltl]|uniref:Uncharacterized protein n=1 Tax=Pleurodeles waltl TaxID=8319 RepID=A0AAV7SN68_PLEWA|nr:hypothetical protein NDU88_005880 [Pleurodeles waltl]